MYYDEVIASLCKALLKIHKQYFPDQKKQRYTLYKYAKGIGFKNDNIQSALYTITNIYIAYQIAFAEHEEAKIIASGVCNKVWEDLILGRQEDVSVSKPNLKIVYRRD